MVVRELQDGSTLRELRSTFRHGAQVVEREAVVVAVREQRHAQVLHVEVQALLRVLLEKGHGTGVKLEKGLKVLRFEAHQQCIS